MATPAGTATCVTCHQQEAAAWTGSHHDLAMQVPTDASVLGDFDDASFTYYGRTSTFFRRDDAFFVRTTGADGLPHEYRIHWTFGADPLQQYVIGFPEGAFQMLGIAWDARPAQDGGRRWYHLYPDEDIAPGDALHWTSPTMRWNYQCAACHSTTLRKNYDPETGRYATTFTDIDVGCEACHGPGSAHVEWAASQGTAQAGEATGAPDGGPATRREAPRDDTGRQRPTTSRDIGLKVDLSDRDGGRWGFEAGAAIASRAPARSTRPELASCGPCHSRRQLIDEDPEPGASLLDVIRPALLTEGLYFSDGQIEDEVFVLGSFLQSTMYAHGVTCGDCHDPHTLRLRVSGNALCDRCHLTEVYDTPAHHNHDAESAGAECVACHMPTRVYMGVDARRDHSMRVPRPDLTVSLGAPNACNQCHTAESAAWAAGSVARWYGPDRRAHYGEGIARGREDGEGAGQALATLASDTSRPGIVRATALEMLARHPGVLPSRAVTNGLFDADPLIRYGAILGIDAVLPQQRATLLEPLLRDSVRLVRTEAARALALAPAPPSMSTALLDSVIAEYVQAQMVHADRAEAHVNTATVLAARGRVVEAERALEMAIRVDSTFLPAWVNHADLLRALGRDAEGEALLRRAIDAIEEDAAARHALGLLLVRQDRLDEAIVELAAAADAQPDDARFAYVHAVALHSAGQVDTAIEALARARARHPRNVEILTALVVYNRDAGRLDQAIELARQWVLLEPENPAARQELANLERLRGR